MVKKKWMKMKEWDDDDMRKDNGSENIGKGKENS